MSGSGHWSPSTCQPERGRRSCCRPRWPEWTRGVSLPASLGDQIGHLHLVEPQPHERVRGRRQFLQLTGSLADRPFSKFFDVEGLFFGHCLFPSLAGREPFHWWPADVAPAGDGCRRRANNARSRIFLGRVHCTSKGVARTRVRSTERTANPEPPNPWSGNRQTGRSLRRGRGGVYSMRVMVSTVETRHRGHRRGRSPIVGPAGSRARLCLMSVQLMSQATG